MFSIQFSREKSRRFPMGKYWPFQLIDWWKNKYIIFHVHNLGGWWSAAELVNLKGPSIHLSAVLRVSCETKYVSFAPSLLLWKGNLDLIKSILISHSAVLLLLSRPLLHSPIKLELFAQLGMNDCFDCWRTFVLSCVFWLGRLSKRFLRLNLFTSFVSQ